MTPQGEARKAGSRPEPDAAQSLSSEVAERSGRYERELTALAQDVQAILQRHEERARDAADHLLIEARIEAARMLSEARREVTALAEQMESLKRAQQEASLALQQTRDALAAALGSVEAVQHPSPQRTPPPANAAGPTTKENRTAPSSEQAGSPAERAETVWPPATTRVQRRRRAASAKPWLVGIAAAVLLATAAAVWSLVRRPTESPARAAGAAAERRDPRATAAPADPTASRPPRGSVAPSRTPTAPMILTLEAVRPAWVRAIVDGRTEKGSVLAAGERRRITASSDVVIRAGDAGALLVTIDGGEKSRFGRDGQVRTRRFARSASTTAPPGPAVAERSPQPDRAVAEPVAATEPAPARPPAAPVSLVEMPVTSGSGPLEGAAVGTSLALAAPPVPTAAGRTSSTAVDEILELDRQWFEAYYRNEPTGLARLSAPGFEMADSRSPVQERRPASPPARSIHDVRVDVHGDGAVLSGRMIERLSLGGQTSEQESFVSEVWVRREGTWRLLSLRLAGADQVRQTGATLVR